MRLAYWALEIMFYFTPKLSTLWGILTDCPFKLWQIIYCMTFWQFTTIQFITWFPIAPMSLSYIFHTPLKSSWVVNQFIYDSIPHMFRRWCSLHYYVTCFFLTLYVYNSNELLCYLCIDNCAHDDVDDALWRGKWNLLRNGFE